MGSSIHKPRAREFLCDLEDPPLYSEEEIKQRHAKQLLKELRRMRARLDMYHEDDAALQYVAQLKAELATREHVPNKQEARRNRQDKAKRRRHR
jgi:hypothetical protein